MKRSPTGVQRKFRLHLSLLGHFQGIVDLYAQVPNSAFQLAMAQQQLDDPQVLGSFVDQRSFGSPH
jgi:hypothetical protein